MSLEGKPWVRSQVRPISFFVYGKRSEDYNWTPSKKFPTHDANVTFPPVAVKSSWTNHLLYFPAQMPSVNTYVPHLNAECILPWNINKHQASNKCQVWTWQKETTHDRCVPGMITICCQFSQLHYGLLYNQGKYLPIHATSRPMFCFGFSVT